MRRSGKLAAVALVSLLGSGCHKRTLPAPPPVPTAQAPATTPPQTEQTPPSARPQTAPPLSPTKPETVQPPPQQPEFRLGQALTPEQQRANNALIDRHLQQATQALGSIGNRPLTNEQRSSVAQIRGFIDQARQMRGTDIVRARSLAERADVLAQDLVSRLK
jgi:hypothetical protein